MGGSKVGLVDVQRGCQAGEGRINQDRGMEVEARARCCRSVKVYTFKSFDCIVYDLTEQVLALISRNARSLRFVVSGAEVDRGSPSPRLGTTRFCHHLLRTEY